MTKTQAVKRANRAATQTGNAYFVFRDPCRYPEDRNAYGYCNDREYYNSPWLEEQDVIYSTEEGYY